MTDIVTLKGLQKVTTCVEREFYSDHNKLITSNTDAFKEDGSILFKFRKGAISESVSKVALSAFSSEARKGNHIRGVAGGSVEGQRSSVGNNTIHSNIAGYYDKPKMRDNAQFKNRVTCRLTAFTRDKLEKWESSKEFFKVIEDYYQRLAPGQYYLQMTNIQKSPFSVFDGPFSTVTMNHNWRTACHKDSGDFRLGLGNLVTLGNFTGYELLFPEYKIAVRMEPGDLMIMDVHEYHCNLEAGDGDRYSFVCYLRENMSRCGKRTTNQDGEEMFIEA